jgi:hypothetical protein
MIRRGQSLAPRTGGTAALVGAVLLLVLVGSAGRANADAIGDPLPSSTQAWDVLATDFDGQHGRDIVITPHSASSGTAGGIYHANASGGWTLGWRFPAGDRHGCDAGDVDGDSRPDLYCELGSHQGTGSKLNNLFLQQPDGTFVDQAVAWGVEDAYGRGRRPLLYDHNNDGRLDLYTTVWGPRTDANLNVNRLFINKGTHFEERVTAATGRHGARCVTHGDWDGDGFRDLIVCGNDGDAGSTTLRLFKNKNGVGHRDVDFLLGDPIPWPLDAKLVDLSGDGLDDLVVVRKTRLQVRINLGTGNRFSQVTRQRALVEGQRALVEDLTGDGIADIYVTEGCDAAGVDAPDSFFVGSKFTRVPIEREAAEGCGSEAITAGKLLIFNGTEGLVGPVTIRDLPLPVG